MLGRPVVRSEKLIELGDSWFSTKSILVELHNKYGGRALRVHNGGVKPLLSLLKLRIP